MAPQGIGFAGRVPKLCDVSRPTLRCTHCHLRGHCLPSGLEVRIMDRLGLAERVGKSASLISRSYVRDETIGASAPPR